jgi:hypothetical protein
MRLVDQLYSPQPFHVIDALPADDDQARRVALLGSHRLAILSVRDQTIVHAFLDGNAFQVVGGSAPSAIIHVAVFCTAACCNNNDSGTPVHKLQLVSP